MCVTHKTWSSWPRTDLWKADAFKATAWSTPSRSAPWSCHQTVELGETVGSGARTTVLGCWEPLLGRDG